MKQLEVQIMGQSYLLGCPENGEAQMLSAVSRVDSAMCKIRDAGKIKARDRIAVLAALNLAFEVTEQLAMAAPAPAAAPSAAPVPQAQQLQQSDLQLQAVLARLDSALGSDGRLL